MKFRIASIALSALSLAACLKPGFKPVKGGPTLKFSADYDTAFHAFELSADFKSTTDNFFCKTFIFGLGEMRPTQNHGYFQVPGPGAVVEVPLALKKSGGCEWRLSAVHLKDVKPVCKTMNGDGFEPPWADTAHGSSPPLPDTVDYVCTPLSGSDCDECESTNGERSYVLNPSGDAVHYRIRHAPAAP